MIKLYQTFAFFLLFGVMAPNGINAQNKTISVNWKWNDPSYNGTKIIDPTDKIKISFEQKPDAVQRKTFVKKTIVTVTDDKGKSHRIDLTKDLKILKDKVSFLLSDYLGEVKEGYKITISPNFGTVAFAPLVFEVKSVQPHEEACLEKIKELEGKVDKSEQANQEIQKTVDALEKERDKANQQKTDLEGKLTILANEDLSRKQRKELKRLDDNKILYSYPDCESCLDQDGDLIYDFRCKQLIRVHTYRDIDRKEYTDYYRVKNLNEIKVAYRGLLRLKIVGVNRYIYNIGVTVNEKTFTTQTPSIWKSFFGGTEGLAATLSGKLNDPNYLEAGGEDEKKLDTDPIIEAIKKFEKDYNKLLQQQLNAYWHCYDAKCCKDALPKEDLSYFADQLTDINYMLLEAEMTALKGIPGGIELNAQITAKQDTYDKTKSFCDLKVEIDDLTKKISETTAAADADKLAKLKEDLAKKKAEQSKLSVTSACEANTVPNLEKELSALKDKLPLRTAMDKVRGSLPTQDDLRELYLFDKNLTQDNFVYRLPPYYPDKDKLSITLDINAGNPEEAKKMNVEPVYHDNFNLEFPVRNKVLFSFSSGPYVNLFANNSIKSYDWQSVPASGNLIDNNVRYRLVESGKAPLPYGIAAFGNIGTKMSDNFGLALSFGVGVSVDSNPLPTFMLGLSPSFGDEQRINLSFGIGFSQIRKAKNELYMNSLYTTAQTLEYETPFKAGLFFSLSYAVLTTSTTAKITSSSQPKP